MAYVEPYTPAPAAQEQQRPEFPNALILVQGSFDQAKIEQLIRDRAGAMEDYNGKKMFVHRERARNSRSGSPGRISSQWARPFSSAGHWIMRAARPAMRQTSRPIAR